MQSSEKCVITVDFDGITNWPVSDETENNEYYYSVDL
jgi:hypothetical protein